MYSVYENCPILQNERYLLRLVAKDDCLDLLKVYSDKKSVYLFNSDNCNGDNFYYTSEERMKKQIDFWLTEYESGYYVRWSIIDKHSNEAIGTIELFNRQANDFFNDCGLLRLDLRSDYETVSEIKSVLSLIVKPAFEMFDCIMLATKAIPKAKTRIAVLKEMGFKLSEKKLFGHNGTEYCDYYVLVK